MASADIERHGIVQDEITGEAFIPASQRPDGTWRKPRRVKEGYIPQEEMPTYETKGVQWMKSKSNLPPGLNPEEAEKAKTAQTAPGQPLSKSAKKNLKRKEKKKQQPQEEQTGRIEKVTHSLAETSITNSQSGKNKDSVGQSNLSGDKDKEEILKKVRNLKKKLKQVEGLEQRIKSGELKNPEKEQLDKIAKKQTLIDEIEYLELELDD